MDIKVADEVWIGTALLHYENPSSKSFSNTLILERIKQENIFGIIRPGIQTHIVSHCLANKPAQPNTCRMLYVLPDRTKRLYKVSDNCHPSRQNGKTMPNKDDIPKKYSSLIDWYKNEYNRAATKDPPTEHKLGKFTTTKHDERCPECKQTIGEILEQTYGEVKRNYKFQIGTSPSEFNDKKYGEGLKKIFEALQEHRGFRDFIKAKTLPNCDFFVPNPGFVLEFDETQHFTSARKLALELYPEELKLGFDRKKWIELCNKIHARDNDPPYRDEQRAWYDTLRDFLPEIVGLKPTIRIFAKDFAWCYLNPKIRPDLERFKSLMQSISCRETAIREDPNPTIARIILTEEWQGNLDDAKGILSNICNNWPKGKKVKFLVTCGGFLQFDWPQTITREEIGDNKYPEGEAINYLVGEAKKCADYVLRDGLGEKLERLADYVTFGVDSRKSKVSTTKNYIGQLHAELVILADLKNKRLYWSGKSYPTNSQEKGLVRIQDLTSHFFDLIAGKTLILGCHDLAVFNPRSINASGWRKQVNEEFTKMAKEQKPVYVLHHPHTTVKRLTWWNAWQQLNKTLPSVKQYAGAGTYFEFDRKRVEWDPLEVVCVATKKGNTIDFIIG